MPIALFLLIALYLWLVWLRTRGRDGKALVGEEAMKAEKLLRLVRVGMMLAAVVLLVAIIWMSGARNAEAPINPETAPAPSSEPSWRGALTEIGIFLGLWGEGAVLPFFVIAGTAISYGYTIVMAAKVIGFYREMRHRRRTSAPAA